jgi:ATP-dependent DNA helicase RecG
MCGFTYLNDMDHLMSLALTSSVSELKGVGPALLEKLSRLGIITIQDLLFHLPLRYEDRSRLVALPACRPGDYVLIEAKITKTWQVYAKRRTLLCQLSDGHRKLTLRFFYFNQKQKQNLQVLGNTVRCFGEVRLSRLGLEMVHPEYTIIAPGDVLPLDQSLTPVYPLTEGMTQKTLRKLVPKALAVLETMELADFVDDYADADAERASFMPLKQALTLMHQPPRLACQKERQALIDRARSRLALGELLAYQLRLQELRALIKNQSGFVMQKDESSHQQFLAGLPFELTSAQRRVINEIVFDLASGQPMLRLLQGDVGSGKTLVAIAALLVAVKNKYTAVLMAPTEILAQQHFEQCEKFLAPLGVSVGCLVGGMSAREQKEMRFSIKKNEVQVIVGTHALFQEKVTYARLGLVIVDEQHRFGVHQRLSLQLKGKQGNCLPHQLVMTATPIPRTLAMTAYADLDYSAIDELPPGRQPITTTLLSEENRTDLIERLKDYCQRGRQAYWVCTLIETSEVIASQAAQDMAQLLAASLPEQRIGLLHGRLSAEKKQQVMQAFKSGAIDVLVATTVIEVGVDVPNASVMVIDGAERLGLAQLHQLRGRVGRGGEKSFCLLLHAKRLSRDGVARLSIMRETQNGFTLAEEDMRIRGPGEILGKRQAGLMLFRVADITRDQALIELAKTIALRIAEDAVLCGHLIKRWQFDQKSELFSG